MARTFTLEQIYEMQEEEGGWCLTCGEEAYGIEPDARKYKCEACGARAVYGAEEMVVMGLVA